MDSSDHPGDQHSDQEPSQEPPGSVDSPKASLSSVWRTASEKPTMQQERLTTKDTDIVVASDDMSLNQARQ
jgi:hypothetical protein